MARIFISHNSQDAKEAAALKRWLTDNGWDDTFLDIDAKDGLSPGERWKDALKNAADRCEAVLCLVSPTWLASADGDPLPYSTFQGSARAEPSVLVEPITDAADRLDQVGPVSHLLA